MKKFVVVLFCVVFVSLLLVAGCSTVSEGPPALPDDGGADVGQSSSGSGSLPPPLPPVVWSSRRPCSRHSSWLRV